MFRQRKEGDRIALARQSGSRPLKKLWNEAKTPQQQRWRSAVLSDSDGVVWVEGFGADRRVLPDDGSKTVALIWVEEEIR